MAALESHRSHFHVQSAAVVSLDVAIGFRHASVAFSWTGFTMNASCK